MVTVVAYNVNSIKARQERLLTWLDACSPDVALLQETKTIDEAFPREPLEERGYTCAIHGQKTYNGVAILSKEPIEEIATGFQDGGDDSQARFIVGKTFGMTVASAYIPNGSELDSNKYGYKKEWLRRLHAFTEKLLATGEPVLIGGDFNIAPEEKDVAKPEKWTESVLTSPEVRQAFADYCALGLADTFRKSHPDAAEFSWWDYRNLGFPKNNGLRIDFLLASAALAERLVEASIDRDERKGKKPSDHAPVMATFHWPE